MEGLRVSKLEEGQQWGKNTSSKDKVQWGRRPPFYRRGKIQPLCAQPAHERYYQEPWGGSTADKRYYHSGPQYYRWDQRGHTEKGNEPIIEAERLGGCAKEVYVMIPP